MEHIKFLLICMIAVGLFYSGCKKEGSATEEPSVQVEQTPEQVVKENEFLSDPDVVTCKLENTTISEQYYLKSKLYTSRKYKAIQRESASRRSCRGS